LITCLEHVSTADDAYQYHDDGDDQQDVNESTYRIGGDQAEQPQYQKYNGNSVKHDVAPSPMRNDRQTIDIQAGSAPAECLLLLKQTSPIFESSAEETG
jgi:hypothetical protein